MRNVSQEGMAARARPKAYQLPGLFVGALGLIPASPVLSQGIADVVASMNAGQWKELPDTSVREVLPEQEAHPHWGQQGPEAVMRSWSGAAYDTTRNRLIMKGGGQGAYGGNEVYEFDLEAMTWERATEPSRHELDPAFSDNRASNQFYRTVDGTPVSRNTYDGLVYLPNVDKTFMWGSGLYRIGTSYDAHAWLYDTQARTWTRGAAADSTRVQAVTAYDPESERVLVEYGRGLYGYNPVHDTWEVISAHNSPVHGQVGDLDTQRRLFIQAHVANNGASPITYYDLNDPDAGRRMPEMTGESRFDEGPVPGMAFDPSTGYMLLWNGWKQTWVLDPDTWRVRQLNNAPGPGPHHYGIGYYPIDANYKTNGIFGRWAYVPDYDVFIGYGDVDDNVWLYRLPENPFDWKPPEDPDAVRCTADFCVGPDFRLKLPSQAAQHAQDGDTVAIQPGDYNDCARWRQSVTIRGLGGRPGIGGKVCDRKAVWITRGDETLIENVELHGGSGDNRNGEAIRHEGKRLTVKDSLLHSSRMGIMTNHGQAIEVELYNNEFHSMRNRSGLSHQVYAGRIGSLIAEGNYMHQNELGHLIKSVAGENRISYNYLVNENNAKASLINVWGCSVSDIVGNVLVYGGETGALHGIGIVHRRKDGQNLPCEREPFFNIVHNTAVFESDDQRWSSFVRNRFGVEYYIANNLVVNTRGIQHRSSASATALGHMVGNIHLDNKEDSLFVAPSSDDFRLAKRITETAEDTVHPRKEYKHRAATRERTTVRHPGAHEVFAGE